jgi:hypothetical protein
MTRDLTRIDLDTIRPEDLYDEVVAAVGGGEDLLLIEDGKPVAVLAILPPAPAVDAWLAARRQEPDWDAEIRAGAEKLMMRPTSASAMTDQLLGRVMRLGPPEAAAAMFGDNFRSDPCQPGGSHDCRNSACTCPGHKGIQAGARCHFAVGPDGCRDAQPSKSHPIHNRYAQPVTGAHPDDYPLSGTCRTCGHLIACADGTADWGHATTDALPGPSPRALAALDFLDGLAWPQCTDPPTGKCADETCPVHGSQTPEPPGVCDSRGPCICRGRGGHINPECPWFGTDGTYDPATGTWSD